MNAENVEKADSNPWIDEKERVAIESDGVWVEWRYGWRFKVRRKGEWNREFQAVGARLAARADYKSLLKRSSGKDYVPSDADISLVRMMKIEAFVEGCLVEWENVIDPNGNVLPFNVKAAKLLLRHFRDLFTFLDNFAEDAENFAPVPPPPADELLGN